MSGFFVTSVTIMDNIETDYLFCVVNVKSMWLDMKQQTTICYKKQYNINRRGDNNVNGAFLGFCCGMNSIWMKNLDNYL